MNEKALSYSDVLLVPKYSELLSRSYADTSVKFLGRKYKLPITPADMLSVIDSKIAKYLSNNGYFYIYHRFGWDKGGNVDALQPPTELFVRQANKENWNLISISTGVSDADLVTLDNIRNDDLKVDVITIDIAHAHHSKVRDRIKWIKKQKFKFSPKIIVGNVTTPQAVCDLVKWGADAVKVGIGQGAACSTRLKTGFSMPMFTAIQNCTNTHFWHNETEYTQMPNVEIIADGGIKEIGDIPKALVAGATMVMSGSLFARCSDSPAKIKNGKKVYFGSASYENKGHNKHIEGFSTELEQDVSYEEKLEEIKQALSSAISYGGGRDLNCFRDVDYVVV